MKAMAYAAARERWPEATIEYEGVVPDAEQRERRRAYLDRVGDRINLDWNTPHANQQEMERKKVDNPKRADVLVRFSEEYSGDGRGVAIECQYRHESKDIEAAVTRFLEFNYTTLLLHQRHFERGIVDFEDGIWRTRPEPQGNLVKLATLKDSEWHWAVETDQNDQLDDAGTKPYWSVSYITACGRHFDESEDTVNVGQYPRMLISDYEDDQRCLECWGALLDELGHR